MRIKTVEEITTFISRKHIINPGTQIDFEIYQSQMSSAFGKSLLTSFLHWLKGIFFQCWAKIFFTTVHTFGSATEKEIKLTRHPCTMKRSLLNFEQAGLRGFDLCSLYCPLCFDCGVYSDMIIINSVMETRRLILFNNVSLPYSHPPCKPFVTSKLRNRAVERIERYFKNCKS